jgi:AraC-like DNA-binding protein
MGENYFQYLPISKSNIEWDLYLTGTGAADILPKEQYPPKGHPGTYDFKWEKGRVLPEYQLVYISKGSGIFESTEMGEVKIDSGQAILLFPGQWHRYRPEPATGWKEHWISWNGEYLYRLTKRKYITPRNAILPVKEPESILPLYDRILSIIRQHPAENSRVLAAIGMEILAVILESSREKPVRQDAIKLKAKYDVEDKLAANAMRLIWSHSYRTNTIENIAEQLCITRRTLERRFRKAFGRTPGQEITHRRIERAKHLLINTKLPIEHIALAVGFSGAVRLGKVFQKMEKTTPSQFRNKRRKSKL